MTTVGSHEAKTHLSSLLRRAADGEKITITRHGKPIAILVPVDIPSKADAAAAVEAMKEFRKGRSLGGLSITDMIKEGRRF